MAASRRPAPFTLHRSYEPDRERQVAALLLLLGAAPRALPASPAPPTFSEEELRRRPTYRGGRRTRRGRDDAR
jgi:hypothetical protein